MERFSIPGDTFDEGSFNQRPESQEGKKPFLEACEIVCQGHIKVRDSNDLLFPGNSKDTVV